MRFGVQEGRAGLVLGDGGALADVARASAGALRNRCLAGQEGEGG